MLRGKDLQEFMEMKRGASAHRPSANSTGYDRKAQAMWFGAVPEEVLRSQMFAYCSRFNRNCRWPRISPLECYPS